jgi:transcriptional regulator
MYISKHHALNEREAVVALMQAHPLGAWVCHAPGGLLANHVPFYLDRTRGPHGTLLGHVARANSVWRQLGPEAPSVVMFQGAQAYISPGWYPGRAQHGRVVPTWNYVVAHAHGVARVVEDPAWMRDMLERLTATHEATQSRPWRMDEAPADYMEKLMRAIVGIEIPIDRLEGKLKASQDEDLQDRHGTALGLQACPGDHCQAMAQRVLNAIATDASDAGKASAAADVPPG